MGGARVEGTISDPAPFGGASFPALPQPPTERQTTPRIAAAPADDAAGLAGPGDDRAGYDRTDYRSRSVRLGARVVQIVVRDRRACAVRLAGGATEDADLDAINLAQPLIDARQYDIPYQGETETDSASRLESEEESSTNGLAAASEENLLVNVNTASPEALDTLPGIGPVKAAAIIAHRESNGPFRTTEDLLQVPGIGPNTLAQLEALITVGP